MRISTAQKDLAGHTKQLRGPNVARGLRVGQPYLSRLRRKRILTIQPVETVLFATFKITISKHFLRHLNFYWNKTNRFQCFIKKHSKNTTEFTLVTDCLEASATMEEGCVFTKTHFSNWVVSMENVTSKKMFL